MLSLHAGASSSLPSGRGPQSPHSHGPKRPPGCALPKLLHRILPAPLRRKVALWPHRQAAQRLTRALHAPQAAQRRALAQIVEGNQQTEFGRTHGFARVTGLSDYVAKVPLRRYRDLEPYLRRQLEGSDEASDKAGVLFAGAVEARLLDTRGGRRRTLPLSAAGLAQRLWCEQLLEHKVLEHRVHTSGAPWLTLFPCTTLPTDRPPAAADDPASNAETAGGRESAEQTEAPPKVAPVATASVEGVGALPQELVLARAQAEVLGKAGAPPLPFELFAVAEEQQRFYLLLRLGLERRVSVLRAANPGTLLVLAEQVELLADRLLDDLAGGAISMREGLPKTMQGQLPTQLKPQPKRAAELRELRAAHGRLEPRHLWPELGLLVCDCGGPARLAAERLPDRFGDLALIDSGHWGAEGMLTLPTTGDEGGLALLEGQLLEFLPTSDEESAPTLPADGLRLGERYLPVLTSHDGLYRLLLDQIVEVTEIDGGTPRLARCGPSETRVPLGEGQLEEHTVREALLEVCRELDVVVSGHTAWLQDPDEVLPPPQGETDEESPGFWRRLFGRKAKKAAPSREPTLTWAIETERGLDKDGLRKLARAAESELRRSCETYAKQRANKALGEARLLLLRPGSFARFTRRRLAEGRPGGHLPPPNLREVPLRLHPEDLERL
ncbi:MAG: hypothetical protein CSA65_06635 [Proteobacteria bacterium]|nr:MAG: hypothetical protein CSA65_06635 [Pseudomonadota bacterium]